ncbi:TraR/DksA family transcriptional regulator [Streptomyces sp. NPDC053542]|uniref:TraR/DksA family transcriptional regulator n=1 Tax=Streptomyces sp. NPDC053542 TaxID=3365710 RepID=UPI0037D56A21
MVNQPIISDRDTTLAAEELAALRADLHEQRRFRQDQLRQIAGVEAALARMDQGRYGLCHRCRRPIDREFLLIVPQARYRARCRHVREAGR